MDTTNMQSLVRSRDRVNSWMDKNNAGFALLRHGKTEILSSPFDPIPHVIPGDRFTRLERGLMQRVNAINLLLNDLYGKRMIIKDGVIPEDFVYSSSDFHIPCVGFTPVKSLYNHITAVDLACAADGKWYVMEDHLALPSGAAYPIFARKLSRSVSPDLYPEDNLCDNNGYNILLNRLYRDVTNGMDNKDGITVILSPGEGSFSHFELNYLAELTGAVCATSKELTVMDDTVYYRPAEGGGFQKVAVIHRHISDNSLDPLAFDVNSKTGVAHLMECYRKGKVAIINAPGSGVADDKGLFCYIPDAIRYYLGEEPLLENTPTYLPYREDERKYIFDNLDRLIVKHVNGPKAVTSIMGSGLTRSQLSDLKARLAAEPRRYVAQDIVDLAPMDALSADGTRIVTCKADYRAFVIHCDSIRVWMGGLTKFSHTAADGSRHSGYKDTWIMSR